MSVQSIKALARRLLGRPTPRRLLMRQDPRYAKYDIGRGTYGTPSVHDWDDGTKLSIGRYTSIADEVTILLGGEHRTDWVSTYPFNALRPEFEHIGGHPRSRGDVRIGNDVWIGFGALLTSGVTVGDGAVIGARSVVTRSVAPYTIVGGSPAKLIRSRFDEATIAHLLDAAWWELPDDDVHRLVPLLLSPDTAALIDAVAAIRAGRR